MKKYKQAKSKVKKRIKSYKILVWEHCDEEEQEQEENECKHCRVEDVSYKGYCSRACYLYDNE